VGTEKEGARNQESDIPLRPRNCTGKGGLTGGLRAEEVKTLFCTVPDGDQGEKKKKGESSVG